MDIFFQDRKLEKICNNQSLLVKNYGSARAKILRRRLDDLRAVDNLEIMYSLPKGRCHELIGNRKGQLAMDLDGPYRLIFEPANNPVSIKPDGGLDRTKVTVIRVLALENYHD